MQQMSGALMFVLSIRMLSSGCDLDAALEHSRAAPRRPRVAEQTFFVYSTFQQPNYNLVYSSVLNARPVLTFSQQPPLSE